MTTINGLHPRAVQVLQYLHRFAAEHGRTPTYPEISAALGISITTITTRTATLEARGWVERGGKYAPLRLTGKPWPGPS